MVECLVCGRDVFFYLGYPVCAHCAYKYKLSVRELNHSFIGCMSIVEFVRCMV